MHKTTKEPLFHIVRRRSMIWPKVLGIRLLSILLALIACAVITTLLTGDNPLAVYATMLYGNFGTARKIWMLLQGIAILLCVSLALAPAFRMRFWNIGGEGQLLMGGLAAASCMILLGDKIPNAVLIPLMIILSVAAGALWAVIPAFFKARWGTNETLFTLMMNYVATQLVAYFIIVWEVPKGSGQIGIINQNTQVGWLPQIGDYKYLLNILVAAAITVFIHLYLKYSKQGYELDVVGQSVNTARYIGIKVDRVIMRTMILSGSICGVAGLLLVAGTDHTLTTTLGAGRGFTGVMVAWLANNNPLSMILTSFLLVFMSRGASEIATEFGFNHAFGDILTGVIIFFIIGMEFFIRYKVVFHKKSEEG